MIFFHNNKLFFITKFNYIFHLFFLTISKIIYVLILLILTWLENQSKQLFTLDHFHFCSVTM